MGVRWRNDVWQVLNIMEALNMDESNKVFTKVIKLMAPQMLSALEKRYKLETGSSAVSGDSEFDFTDQFLEWEESYCRAMIEKGGTPAEIIARMDDDLK